MGWLLRSIFTSKSWWGRIVAIVALAAIVDNRLPDGIFDRKNIASSTEDVASSSMSDESALCIQTLFDFTSTMIDNQNKYIDIAVNSQEGTEDTLSQPICEPPTGTTQEEYTAAFEDCMTALADNVDSRAQEMRRLREQALVQSPPVCAVNLATDPMTPNEPHYEFPDGKKVDNRAFVRFEVDLRKSHEQFLKMTDATYECFGEIERSTVQATLGDDEIFDTTDGPYCHRSETAIAIFNEHYAAVRDFIIPFLDESVPELDTHNMESDSA